MKHPLPLSFALAAALAACPATHGRLAAQDTVRTPAGVPVQQQPVTVAPQRQDSTTAAQEPAPARTEPRRQQVTGVPTVPGPRIGPGIVPGGVTSPPQRRAVVPPLAGRTVAEARVLLADRGLELGAVGEMASAREPGTVVLQRPGSGAVVPRGTAVAVQIARGRVAMVTVPPLRGQTMGAAAALLDRAGLRTGRVSGARGDPEARVERHSPAAGRAVPPGTRVDLLLVAPTPVPGPVEERDPAPVDEPDPAPDQEPEPAPVADPQPDSVPTQPAPASVPVAPAVLPADSAGVPDVRGLRLDEAIDRLAEAGLIAEIEASSPGDRPDWSVARQDPGPGAPLVPASSVLLVLTAPLAALPPAAAPVAAPPGRDWGRMGGWLLVLLLLVAAAAALRRGRGRAAAAGPVRARTRAPAAPRVRVVGTPFGAARVRLRPGTAASPAATVSPGPLFTHKEAARG